MEAENKEKIKLSLKKYLTKKEQEETLKAFRLFDQDGSGSISIRVNSILFRNSIKL
jgi:Ca2+-binding EF-hand superfamily protein